jgi:hypothetical protein
MDMPENTKPGFREASSTTAMGELKLAPSSEDFT